MSNESVPKGRALEKAVKLIQQNILESDPEVRGTKFTIATNQIVRVSGVRHEIDVLVKTQPGSQFESSWAFECKNWQTPVGKNEVMILSGKVSALAANRGFLVARSLTSDAVAQLKLDPRLRFIQCSDDFFTPYNFQLLQQMHEPFSIQVYFKQRGVVPTKGPDLLDWKTLKCCLDGRSVEISDIVYEFVDQLIEQDKKENANRYNFESTHWQTRAGAVDYLPSEFFINEMEIEQMTIAIHFWVVVKQRRLVSKFELKEHGRVFSFEPIEFEGGARTEIDIVQRVEKTDPTARPLRRQQFG